VGIKLLGPGGPLDRGNVPYSDSNPPESLMVTEAAVNPAAPAAGLAVVHVDADGAPYLTTDAGFERPLVGPHVRRHTAANTNATTTQQIIAALNVALDIGAHTWVWEGTYIMAAATGYGLRLRVTTPASATGTAHGFTIGVSTTGVTIGAATGVSAVLGTATTSGGSTALPFRIWGSAVLPAAGTLQFAHAPSAAGSSTIQLGSTVTVSRLTV
jgi:hypothetical protein